METDANHTPAAGRSLHGEPESSHLETRRIRFESILAPTDLSPASKTAMKLAARFAKQFLAKLYVLHSVIPEIYAVGMGEALPTFDQFNLESAQAALRQYARLIPDLRAVKHEQMVFFGSPNNSIQIAVETKAIDLLVLGSHGRTGLAKLALGSVAEWAIRHLHCPVLVAGPQCHKVPRPVKSIVYATELAVESLRPAQYASSIAQEYNAAITLMHVLPTAHTAEAVDHAKRAAMERLRELLPADAQEWCTPRFAVETGDVAAAILHTAQSKRANMIVMGARHQSPLADHAPWSTLSEVIHGARCPVLVVPAHSA